MLPRLIVAAPNPGAGKTTVALALVAAFRAWGIVVQPYKVGPDHADTALLSTATSRTTRSLDGFSTGEAEILEIMRRGMRGADVALIEGAGGLFDGQDPLGQVGSTAQVAKILRTPILLVIDASGTSGSVAAIARGFRDHDPRLPLAGVIANRVASSRHARVLGEVLETVGVPLLGYLAHDEGIGSSRHSSALAPSAIGSELAADRLIRAAETLDLNRLLRLSGAVPELPNLPHALPASREPARGRIAVARDEAFNLHRMDNLELLELSGAELVFFSPLHDPELPGEAGGVYLGGGRPEAYAEQISKNRSLFQAMHDFPGPVYAEGGGLAYLSRALRTERGIFAMAGLIPLATQVRSRSVPDYCEVVALIDSPIARAGWSLRGHESRYSAAPSPPHGSPLFPPTYHAPPLPPAYRIEGTAITEGFTNGKVLASSINVCFASRPEVAQRLVEASSWPSR